MACSFGKPVFVTTGAKNLKPYVQRATTRQVDLIVRVLSHPDSIQSAMEAGCPENKIITGRGPFSVEDNLAVLREFNIGVLVTKDSGEAGGAPEKIEAAKKAGCHVVMVSRPKEKSDQVFERISELVEAVKRFLEKSKS
jgi:precorrin-6A/cobalt-precorrin-6A reductase